MATTTPASTWADDARGDWKDTYQRRLMTPEQAIAHVKSGDKIWVSVGQRVNKLIEALLARVVDLDDVEIKMLPQSDPGWFDESFNGHLRVNVLYASPATRDAVNSGRADYTPYWIWGPHKALDEGRPEARPIDVSFLSVTPPNEWGYCCIGNSVWDAKTTARRAKLAIAEVNDTIPRTFGDSWIHVSEIDAFVVNNEPPPASRFARAQADPDPWDQTIAEYVATLVRDGDTIQIGTGSTTGYLPRSGVLDGKHDLGYFSELTVPGTVELVKKGVITSRRMETHPGKFVTTTAGSSLEDLAFINDNPMFEFYPTEYIHHPAMIARNDNMVAIDNAIVTDLTGQIGASTIGPKVYSGTGGHFAYAMGAFMSKGGRYICVLPSTAAGGTRSRIVPQLEPGQVVTVPRDIADTVVTEYGIARLLGKTQRERADELIAVAHPDFRAELRREWGRLF